MRVEREQALAFRAARHSLVTRASAGSLLDVAGACGIRDSPPGAALLSLAARLEGVTGPLVDAALRDRSLVRVYGPRGTPFLVPARDLAVFTLGALPVGERSLRELMSRRGAGLDEAGVSAVEALDRLSAAAAEALDGRHLGRGELSAEMARRLPAELTPWCPGCRAHHPDEALFRLVGVRGVWCFASGGGGAEREAPTARLDQWLDPPPPGMDGRPAARAELLRRYLRCYGPSRPAEFAAWAGISAEDARGSVEGLAPELADVDLVGRPARLLAEDLPALADPPPAAGARLLPANDPYLLLRDRETLVPDDAARRRLWRPVGGPGALLVDGRFAGTWRSRRGGRVRRVEVEATEPLSPRDRAAVVEEAERLAALHGDDRAEVTW
jgi:hypothetical protein